MLVNVNSLQIKYFKGKHTYKSLLNLYHSLGKFSRQQIDDIFLIFPRKYTLTFHANCLLRIQLAWSVKAYFLDKIRKISQNVVGELSIKDYWTFPATGDWLWWDLTTCQPLWIILCCLPEKGRQEIEEIVEEMKERDREERGTGMKEI